MLAASGVLAQICYPLLSGTALAVVTVLSVALLAAAAVAHAAATHGRTVAARVLAASAGIGLLGEAVGTRTGLPFGDYAYSYDGRLGPELLGVPVAVPLAWTMLAYPCLLLARELGPTRLARVALGALALTGWDLFLDPQMVAAGHWAWLHPRPGLPGVAGVPLTNYAGWLLVTAVLVGVLDRLVPRAGSPVAGAARRRDIVPAAVLAWTWLGSTLGNLAFFDRPWVALYGFAGMGCVVGPYLWRFLWRARQEDPVPA